MDFQKEPQFRSYLLGVGITAFFFYYQSTDLLGIALSLITVSISILSLYIGLPSENQGLLTQHEAEKQ